MSSYFITGTDTGCGKTEITLGLMQLLQGRGHSVLGMKPVASGAAATPDGLRNEDALRIQAQGSLDLPYSAINPYAYGSPIAPHLAAEQAGEIIDLDVIHSHYQALAAQADSVIVEGVGGWQVPLNRQQGIPDLAVRLQLPVILVVGLRLGCINHALLSVEGILASGVELAGWVGNVVDAGMLVGEENVGAIRERVGVDCLGVVPFMPKPTARQVAGYLEFSFVRLD
ncbi:Dethiobiotin synthetase [hydrothermal vent metagenome]|uniref:Dethiobiotin synthetase n=1 Tax=hydrothermal vent metagenome TaxID=652676 RepID=A0A3B1AHA6_9ZZZZ